MKMTIKSVDINAIHFEYAYHKIRFLPHFSMSQMKKYCKRKSDEKQRTKSTKIIAFYRIFERQFLIAENVFEARENNACLSILNGVL